MNIPQKLKDYIDSNRIPLPPIVDPDEPLQIDSLALVRMVALLETDFDIRLEDEEVIAENFETLRRLSELIASKSNGGEPSETPKPDPSPMPASAENFEHAGPVTEE
jgi:acyl carrier protein